MRDSTGGRFGRLTLKLSFAGAIAGLTCLGHSSMAQRPDRATAPEREIRLAEQARFRAMTRADLAALDTLLGSDLVYTHTDGERQDKSQFLTALRSGELVYSSAQPESVVVRVYGSTALAAGQARMRVRSDGREIGFTIRFLEAYEHRSGRWELIAWQSTRLPGS